MLGFPRLRGALFPLRSVDRRASGGLKIPHFARREAVSKEREHRASNFAGQPPGAQTVTNPKGQQLQAEGNPLPPWIPFSISLTTPSKVTPLSLYDSFPPVADWNGCESLR